MLFTSYATLRAVQAIAEMALDYPILVQGTAPRSQLLKQFRETPHAVLLATSSFWQGVDVVGEALSCVIIDKLPFASPGDPITAARIEAIRARGGEPFDEYQVPLAILALQQGLGPAHPSPDATAGSWRCSIPVSGPRATAGGSWPRCRPRRSSIELDAVVGVSSLLISCKLFLHSRVPVIFRRVRNDPPICRPPGGQDRVGQRGRLPVRAAGRRARAWFRAQWLTRKVSPSTAPRSRSSRPRASTRKFETKTDKKGEFMQIGLQSSGYKVTAEKDKLGAATANTRVSQRGPASVRLVIGGGAGNDPDRGRQDAELRKVFDEGVAAEPRRQVRRSIESFNKALAVNPNCQRLLLQHRLTRTPRRRTTTRPRRTTRRRSR